ncbi:MAG: mechanosensitive ion channel [Deltaproteobacteria bacterium]|nr:mechanosensitive ion channel [Deltaproteobacteria bacterium]
MHALWGEILAEALDQRSPLLLVAAFVVVPLMRYAAPEERSRRSGIFLLVAAHLVLVPVAGALRAGPHPGYAQVHAVTLALGACLAVFLGGALLFMVALPRLRLDPPRILQDVMISVAVLVGLLWVASSQGLDVSGVVATSAVATVVIGFALQDTLGNIFAGLALQLDDSFDIGDWIQVGDKSGLVTELRWRYTAIETRNWETLVVPNSVLTKQQVLVLGRRKGQPLQWRRWVYFNVDFRHQPSDVIEAVVGALRAAPIERVATQPEPDCLLMEYKESYCRFAVRYWLNDLRYDDPTDSVVRTRIYFALARANISMSIPAASVFLTKESMGRREKKQKQADDKRVALLRRVELLRELPDPDLAEIAASMRYAPFTRGEVMTRQGARANWLYVVVEGEAEVRIRSDAGHEHAVSTLTDGSIFGELSLLTDEPRPATVVALTDVECFRLDRAAFQTLLSRRPELAEKMAQTLAQRHTQIMSAKEDLARQAPAPLDHTTRDFLAKIRDLFGLDDGR